MTRCKAWLGLEPPLAVDCYRSADHEEPHEAKIIGVVRNEAGEYEDVTVTVAWNAP